MRPTISPTRPFWLLLPVAGSLLFVVLYALAAQRYPGGSQFDPTTLGFSWTQNYWCNLLNEKALNGQMNPARPIALAAMGVLGASLALFWALFPRHAGFSKTGRLAVQLSGAVSMGLGLFIFTDFHDVLINVASLCGLVALIGTFIGLWKLGYKRLLWLGLFNGLLVALNNALYYSDLRQYLPIVQKITFLTFLLWICLIAIQLFKRRA